MFKYLSVLVFFLIECQAQVPGNGQCPIVDQQTNFNLSRFAGTWYEARGYPHTYEIDTKCVEHHYTINSNGSFDVDIKWKNGKNEDFSLDGNARLYYDGCMITHLPIAIGPDVQEDDSKVFCVLGTNYEDYAVVYACKQIQIVFNFFHFVNTWILTRERNPSQEVLNNALEPYNRNNLNTWILRNSIQDGC